MLAMNTSYFMEFKGKIGGILNLNLENSLLNKVVVLGLLTSTMALTVLTTSSVIGNESKTFAKESKRDTNILMRQDLIKNHKKVKEEFEQQIQNIEKESNQKQEELEKVEEIVSNNEQFVQQDVTTSTQAIPTGNCLTALAGVYYGPSGKETYYNLDMSSVINTMRGMGNNDTYWIRGDGAKMLGDYVMVAADLNKYPRGSIVDTSLGKGIVCDTGGFVYNSDTQLDIATNW